jgi:hypothetical protein
MDSVPFIVLIALAGAVAVMAYRGHFALGLVIVGWLSSVMNAIAVYEMTSSMWRALLAAAALFLPALIVAIEIRKGRNSAFVRQPRLGALAFGSCLLASSMGLRFASELPVLNWSQGVIVLATIIVFAVVSVEKRGR